MGQRQNEKMNIGSRHTAPNSIPEGNRKIVTDLSYQQM